MKTKKVGLSSPPQLSPVAAYAWAVALPIAAVAIQYPIRSVGSGPSITLFPLAIAAAAWLAGFGPGLVATAVSAVLGNWLPISSRFDAVLGTLVFLIVGAALTWLIASLRQGVLARDAKAPLAEEKFRLLVESVGDYAIFQLDPSGRVITWNGEARRIKGYEAGEILGQHYSLFFTAEDVEKQKPEQELERALKEGRAEDEGWRVRKDGSRFWASVVLTALRDSNGSLLGLAQVTRDLTERKRAEEMARQSELERFQRQIAEEARQLAERTAERTVRLQRLTAAFYNALTPDSVAQTVIDEVPASVCAESAGLWLLSTSGRRIELAAATGFAAEDRERFHELNLDSSTPVAEAIRTCQPVWIEPRASHVTRHLERESAGQRDPPKLAIACLPLIVSERGAVGALSLSFRDSPELDEDGRAFLVALAQQCAQALDRARLYEAEKKGRAGSEFLAKASAALGESLDFEKTLQTVAQLSVPEFADWAAVDLQAKDETIQRVAVAHVDPAKVQLGWDLFHKFPPTPEDTGGVMNVLRTGQSEYIEEIPDSLLVELIHDEQLLRIIRELKYTSSIVVPMKARGRTIGAITFVLAESNRRYRKEDVTLAEELGVRTGMAVDNAQLYRESLEASRLKDEFLSTLSHELRTPLTAILGWARILEGGGVTEEKRAKAIEIIDRNARVQAQLIEDMLDISRIITGKMRLDLRLTEPQESIEAAVDSVRPAAEAKLIRLRTLLDPRAGPIMGDADRLQQVVWNLLTNAIRFTPKGGQVQVRLTRVNSQVEIDVNDTGEGIAPEFLPHVFDKFRQADTGTKRMSGGLGLGLAIVHHLVELHGGTVEAHSEGIGKGSTFRITLPLASLHYHSAEGVDREHPSAGLRPAPLSLSPVLKGLRVLVVDDQEDARDLLKEVLEEAEASVTCVPDASQALTALVDADWSVLLSDLGMPGDDGFSLIQRVRQRRSTEGGDVPAIAITAYARMEDRTTALRAGFDAHLAKPVDPVELVETVAALARRGRSQVAGT